MRLDAIVIYPGGDPVTVVGETPVQRKSIREARAFDRFAEAVGKHISAEVMVVDSLELPPPADGVIFLCRRDVLDRSIARQADQIHKLASRTVLVDAVRGSELELCHRLALAAAIGSDQYFHWQSSNNATRAAEITGLKSVGRALGATLAAGSEGRDYALFSVPGLREIPSLLDAYLKAYVPLL